MSVTNVSFEFLFFLELTFSTEREKKLEKADRKMCFLVFTNEINFSRIFILIIVPRWIDFFWILLGLGYFCFSLSQFLAPINYQVFLCTTFDKYFSFSNKNSFLDWHHLLFYLRAKITRKRFTTPCFWIVRYIQSNF